MLTAKVWAAQRNLLPKSTVREEELRVEESVGTVLALAPRQQQQHSAVLVLCFLVIQDMT